eukprot:384351-Hanusia_phi.AAC.1
MELGDWVHYWGLGWYHSLAYTGLHTDMLTRGWVVVGMARVGWVLAKGSPAASSRLASDSAGQARPWHCHGAQCIPFHLLSPAFRVFDGGTQMLTVQMLYQSV